MEEDGLLRSILAKIEDLGFIRQLDSLSSDEEAQLIIDAHTVIGNIGIR